MTLPEMHRRLALIPHDQVLAAYHLIRAGHDLGVVRRGVGLSTPLANAVQEWVDRYGMVLPIPRDCAPRTVAAVASQPAPQPPDRRI